MKQPYRNKTKIYLFTFLFFVLIPLVGCGKTTTENVSEQQKFNAFLDACFQEYVSADTVTMHFKLSNPSDYGLSENDSPSYGDFSYETQLENCTRSEELLSELNIFNTSELTSEQQLTWQIFKYSLEQSAASKDYILYQSLLGTNGLQSQIPVTLSEYDLDSEEDIKTYLSLVNQVPDLFEQILSFENKRREAGIICPDFVISDTIEQIDQFIEGSEEDNLLVETFDEKINNLSNMGDDQKNTYINNNRSLIHQVVLPAYESLKENLTDYLNTETNKKRLCQYENGQEYYRLLLSANVGTSMSPEECITALETLLNDTISDIAKLTQENSDLYTAYLSSQPLLSDTEEILQELKTDIQADFPELSDISYTLKIIPDSLSATSACAFYLVPPIDSSDANVIYINNSRVDNQELFSTLAHEGYPGHLYQTNYYLSTGAHPLRSLIRTDGYDEGWGTYAQLYSYNYMEFENVDEQTTKQLQQLYRDNDILSLALSSLCDLYVNYNNYNLNDLKTYLNDYGISKANARSIYRYVIENPTTYLSYSIGYYELLQIQKNMEECLGDSFSIKDYHQIILDMGSCPFTILADQVSKNISEK